MTGQCSEIAEPLKRCDTQESSLRSQAIDLLTGRNIAIATGVTVAAAAFIFRKPILTGVAEGLPPRLVRESTEWNSLAGAEKLQTFSARRAWFGFGKETQPPFQKMVSPYGDAIMFYNGDTVLNWTGPGGKMMSRTLPAKSVSDLPHEVERTAQQMESGAIFPTIVLSDGTKMRPSFVGVQTEFAAQPTSSFIHGQVEIGRDLSDGRYQTTALQYGQLSQGNPERIVDRTRGSGVPGIEQSKGGGFSITREGVMRPDGETKEYSRSWIYGHRESFLGSGTKVYEFMPGNLDGKRMILREDVRKLITVHGDDGIKVENPGVIDIQDLSTGQTARIRASGVVGEPRAADSRSLSTPTRELLDFNGTRISGPEPIDPKTYSEVRRLADQTHDGELISVHLDLRPADKA